jgi:hypothetical protein
LDFAVTTLIVWREAGKKSVFDFAEKTMEKMFSKHRLSVPLTWNQEEIKRILRYYRIKGMM